MTDGQIDELVRSAFSGGIRRLRIYNDKTNYKFGHIGNFNIWIYGNDSLQGNGIAIDHWSGHAFSFRICYPDGAILVSRLVDENMLSLSGVSKIITEIKNLTFSDGKAECSINIGGIGQLAFAAICGDATYYTFACSMIHGTLPNIIISIKCIDVPSLNGSIGIKILLIVQ